MLMEVKYLEKNLPLTLFTANVDTMPFICNTFTGVHKLHLSLFHLFVC